MDDQAEIRQVDAPRRNICCDADLRPPVAERLKRPVAFDLGQLAGQGDGDETSFRQPLLQAADRLARVAENERDGGGEPAEHVDDRRLRLARLDQHGAVRDVGVCAALAGRRYPERITLVAAGEGHDLARDRGREQQGAPVGGRGVEQRLQLRSEAEVQHLVSFIEYGGADGGKVESAAGQVIHQPPRGADDDVRPVVQQSRFAAGVGSADAGNHPRARLGVEPGEFVPDLQCKFTSWRDDQGGWRAGPSSGVSRAAKRLGGDGETEGHGFARSRLGRDK